MEKPFNQLSVSQAERLALLLEELGEAQQAIGKILRHGYSSRNPFDLEGPTNLENLERELGDVVTIMAMMFLAGDIREQLIVDRAAAKAKKIVQYLHHQEELIPYMV